MVLWKRSVFRGFWRIPVRGLWHDRLAPLLPNLLSILWRHKHRSRHRSTFWGGWHPNLERFFVRVDGPHGILVFIVLHFAVWHWFRFPFPINGVRVVLTPLGLAWWVLRGARFHFAIWLPVLSVALRKHRRRWFWSGTVLLLASNRTGRRCGHDWFGFVLRFGEEFAVKVFHFRTVSLFSETQHTKSGHHGFFFF